MYYFFLFATFDLEILNGIKFMNNCFAKTPLKLS